MEWKNEGQLRRGNLGLIIMLISNLLLGEQLRTSDGPGGASSSESSNILSEWDAEVAPSLREFLGTAEGIGGDVSS